MQDIQNFDFETFPLSLALKEIENAQKRISKTKRLPPTCIRPGRPVREGWNSVFYKCDQLRMTGAYKERGALNALLKLSLEKKRNGVIAASAGNHAQALAYHGKALGICVVVVMPIKSPVTKIENCRALGAEVILYGKSFDAAKAHAEEICKKKNMQYINGYDHPDVIFGAATCGLEILDQLPDVQCAIIPVGGGGLIAGCSLAIKAKRPEVLIIGVESEQCPSMSVSLDGGKRLLTPVSEGGTIADGLAVTLVGENSFKIVRRYVDKITKVKEHYIAAGILHLLEKEKLLCEGGGATGVAGILSGQIDEYASKVTCCILTGGNIDMSVLGRIIDRGLYSTGRQMKFDCAVVDMPGGLAHFTRSLSNTGASVKDIVVEHPYISDIRIFTVHVTVETLNKDHCEFIINEMKKHGYILNINATNQYENVNFQKLFKSYIRE